MCRVLAWPTSIRQHHFFTKIMLWFIKFNFIIFFLQREWLQQHFSDQKILLINYWLLVLLPAAAAATASRIRHAKYSATTITKEHFSTPLFCLHSLQVNCNFDCSRHTEQKKNYRFCWRV